MSLGTAAVLRGPIQYHLSMPLNYDAQGHNKWDTCSRLINRKYHAVCVILNSSTSRWKLAIGSCLCTFLSWTTVYKSGFNIPFYKPAFQLTSFYNVLQLKLRVNRCFLLWSAHLPCLRMQVLIMKFEPVPTYAVWRSIIINTQRFRPSVSACLLLLTLNDIVTLWHGT
jgi:hypothetical protein